MKITYTGEDYKDMAECYAQSGGSYREARRLYYARFGVEPSAESIRKAVARFGSRSTARNRISRGPNVSTDEDARQPAAVVKIEKPDPEDDIPLNIIGFENTIVRGDAIVYTTRLDDMLIFNKDFERLDVDDIVENIIAESKPTIGKLQCPRARPSKDEVTFAKLVNNVKKINLLAYTAPLSDINSLDCSFSPKSELNDCVNKEFYVVLEDCNIKPGTTVKVRSEGGRYYIVDSQKLKNVTTVKREKDVRSRLGMLNSGDELPAEYQGGSRSKLNRSSRKRTYRDYGKPKKVIYSSIVFLNRSNSTTDLYFFSANAAAKVFSSLNYLLPRSRIPQDSVVMNCCCWFQRELSIRQIIGCSKHSIRTIELMRNSHGCPANKCTCCCKDKFITFHDDYSTEAIDIHDNLNYYSLSNEQIIEDLLSKSDQGDENDCITKALRYSRNNTHDYTIPDSNNKSVPIEVQIKNNFTNMIEVYYIDQIGNSHKSLEVKAGDGETLDRLYRNSSCINIDDVCCWTKRDWLIHTMQSSLTDNVTNFMRTPHDCNGPNSLEDCLCCCKLKKLSPNTILQSKSMAEIYRTTPTTKLVHCKHYTNKIYLHQKKYMSNNRTYQKPGSVVVRKSKETMPMLFHNRGSSGRPVSAQGAQSPMVTISGTRATLRHTNVTPTATANNLTLRLNQVNTAPTANQVKPTPPTARAISKRPAILSKKTRAKKTEVLAQAQQNPPDTEETNSLLNLGDSENQDPTVNSLVSSILHRFRDVRLNITADGDVSAELNTPINQLSSAELKILSTILAHAKEQVKSIKANPGMCFVSDMVPGNFGSTSSSTLNPNQSVTAATNSTTSNAPLAGTSNPLPLFPNASSVAGKSKTSPSLSVALNTKDHLKKCQSICSHQCYTNLTALKIKQYHNSWKSFMSRKSNDTIVPIIDNVFSLSDSDASQSQMGIAYKPLEVNVLPSASTTGVKLELVKKKSAPKRRKVDIASVNNTPVVAIAAQVTPASINAVPSPGPSSNGTVPVPVGQPVYTMIPQSMINISSTTLNDLVRAPFVPPPFVPNLNYNTSQNPIYLTLTPNTVDFPQIQVGPAFSLAQSTTVEDKVTKMDVADCSAITDDVSSKTDDECILGF